MFSNKENLLFKKIKPKKDSKLKELLDNQIIILSNQLILLQTI